MAFRPDSTVVANRIIAYLYRTGPLDWAGGRWAAYEKRWGRAAGGGAFDFMSEVDDVKASLFHVRAPPLEIAAGVQLFGLPSRAAVELKRPVELASDATFEFKAILVSMPFAPVRLRFGPELPPRPLGFWPLIEHNHSIAYDGDIRACLEEAQRDEDTEAVEICQQLLLMKRTGRENCGRKIEDMIAARGR